MLMLMAIFMLTTYGLKHKALIFNFVLFHNFAKSIESHLYLNCMFWVRNSLIFSVRKTEYISTILAYSQAA